MSIVESQSAITTATDDQVCAKLYTCNHFNSPIARRRHKQIVRYINGIDTSGMPNERSFVLDLCCPRCISGAVVHLPQLDYSVCGTGGETVAVHLHGYHSVVWASTSRLVIARVENFQQIT
ncbi:hypothetical protein LTS09_017807 [Friedmanniomyces endolithicus]|nr:hypothetical protein LTS09_017807 [Friedmanniomyces endolithicus]